MSLKIGDVSKLLNMPVETIRYYEKKNIIHPSREENSNYRIYETWDIFYLLECLMYKSFGLTLKEITSALNNGSLQNLIDQIYEKEISLIDKIDYHNLLLERIHEIKNKLETIALNQGNYWIQKVPDRYYFYCVEGHGDIYNDFDMSNPLFTKMIQYQPFVTAFTKISLKDYYNKLDHEKWFFYIEKKYIKLIKLDIDRHTNILPEQYYMTTIINAGKKGELSIDLITPALDYVKIKGYKIIGDIICELIIRTHRKEQNNRFFQLLIPIEIDVKKKTDNKMKLT